MRCEPCRRSGRVRRAKLARRRKGGRADQSGSSTQLPLQRIEQTNQPTQQQQPALDELKTRRRRPPASSRHPVPNRGQGKLPRTVVQAAKIVRTALDTFYASLSDEQKARFNAMAQPRGQSAS